MQLPENALFKNRQGGQEVYTGRQLNDASEANYSRVGDDGRIWETQFLGGYQEGQEPGLLVGYKFDGIYRSPDDIPADLVVKTGNAVGKYQYGPAAYAKLTDAQKANALQLQPGDAKWADVNGDGVIDVYDQVKIGNTMPRWTGGLNSTLRWKGLSLYARFDFAFDFWTYDGALPWFLGDMQGTYNMTTDVADTWSADNPGAKYPRYTFADQLGTGNYYLTSTLFAHRGDYCAMRELSLTYAMPKSITEKLAMQNLELSLTGQNLGYIFAPPVATPERVYGGGTASGTGYPMPRTVILGVNVTF